MNFKLEICVDSAESAIYAQTAGAHRVELCDNLMEGGTTPGYGVISAAREVLNIGLHVIIRPRGGDFLYSDLEFEIMKREIYNCGISGVDGIVIGILKSDGTIDVDRSGKLVELARPMTVTFHRAFDMCWDPVRSLEDVIATGAARLLTSGQRDKAEEGSELTGQLVSQAGDRIIIMPGSGINETNIAVIAAVTGAKEFHLTGRKIIESRMTYRKEGISMGGVKGIPEFSRMVADREKIERIISILKEI
jgi:copper homeostasis protein